MELFWVVNRRWRVLAMGGFLRPDRRNASKCDALQRVNAAALNEPNTGET
jgi:hypothetical protein